MNMPIFRGGACVLVCAVGAVVGAAEEPAKPASEPVKRIDIYVC